MTVVFHDGALPGGIVTGQMFSVAAASGARSLIAQVQVPVNENGHWQADVTPNQAFTKVSGTFWEFIEPTKAGAPNIYALMVPSQTAPVNAASIAASFAGTTKPAVTGAKGGNAALTSLVSALSALGFITDQTT